MKKVVIRVDPERRQWWKETMSSLLPNYEVYLWDEDKFAHDEITYVITWSPPPGMIASLPNVKCVFSVGAGVSHITDDPTFPRSIPIIRTIGEPLRQRMREYIALHVLRIHRRLPEIENAVRSGQWKQFVEPVANQIRVGIMGVGNLGAAAAFTLKGLGYQVRGLSRRGKPIDGLEVFSREQFAEFLDGLMIVISMLPGTADTENIINAKMINRLPRGAWIINIGRGSQLNEADLIAALDSGHLAGAVLDVFRQEPLPLDNPLWKHPKVLITCHTASAIEPTVGGEIIANNLLAFDSGAKVPDIINIDQGY